MLDKEFYKGREQTYVKHYVLEKYLERLAFKIGMSARITTFNFVDGFSGPWQHADERLQDTSPFIAIEQLSKIRNALSEKGKQFNFRCLFIEKMPEAFKKLEAESAGIVDGEVRTQQGEFENLIPDAARFASTGQNSFGFVFIDPTGWTGFPMHKLTPLFANRRSEILINFMTSFADRFVNSDQPGLAEGFRGLFADENYRQKWEGLRGLDREDAIVQAYCLRLKQAGGYKFVGSTIILDPNADQTCYHLVYATHHPEGMRVFREVEAKAFAEQSTVRSEVARDKRLKKQETPDLFAPDVLQSKYDTDLLNRYHKRAKAALEGFLRKERRTSYDDAE